MSAHVLIVRFIFERFRLINLGRFVALVTVNPISKAAKEQFFYI
jgi:hypothetical protein